MAAWQRARKGANLVEVVVAVVIAGTVLTAMGGFIAGSMKAQRAEGDRAFAQRKALQLLEELAAQQKKDTTDGGLTQHADGASFLLSLAASAPTDPVSDNKAVEGSFRYIRSIEVEPLPNDPLAVRATVKVWDNKPKYPANAPAVPPHPALGVATSIFRSARSSTPAKMAIRIFALNIANVPNVMLNSTSAPIDQYHPGPAQARTDFEAAVAQFEANNPNIDLQVTYVDRLGLGRDPEYRPYANENSRASGGGADALDWAYLYPTTLASPYPGEYLEPKANLALLRGKSSGPVRDSSSETTRLPVADRFNHVVRAPLEYEDFSGVDAITEPRITQAAQGSPSLAQLLNEMGRGNPEYSNALVVNLHGEVFPALPARNYSDAAKDPEDDVDDRFALRRIVTHPLRLIARTNEPVKLLVHPFMEDGRNTDLGTNYTTLNSPWSVTSHARSARVVVKGVRPYFGTLAGGGGSGDIANDLRLSVIQRVDGPGVHEEYEGRIEWPVVASFPSQSVSGTTTHGAAESGSRDEHSGPHITRHSRSSSHDGPCKQGAAGSHGLDPYWSGDDLVITLSDLDYDARELRHNSNYFGLDANARLHGLQYFPDPFLPLLTVRRDSSTGRFEAPRNTARAVIEFGLNSAGWNKRFEVQTLLQASDGTYGPPASTNIYNKQHRISRTWFYGPNAHVPPTELYQLVGDPRHNPYVDVRLAANTTSADAAHNPLLRASLNKYWGNFDRGNFLYRSLEHDTYGPLSSVYAFDNGGAKQDIEYNTLLNPADRPKTYLAVLPGDFRYDLSISGSSRSYDGLKYNVPGYMELWRKALLTSHSVLVNATGAPMRFLAQGGEFSLSGDVDDNAVGAVSGRPFGVGGSAGASADELFSDNLGWVLRPDDAWYAKPWIGELYPTFRSDSERPYEDMFEDEGNLKANPSDSDDRFVRRPISSVSGTDAYWDRSVAHHRVRLGSSALSALVHGVGVPSWTTAGGGGHADLSLNGDGKGSLDNLKVAEPVSGLKARGAFSLTGGSLLDPPPSDERVTASWLLAPKGKSGWGTASGIGGGAQAIGAFKLQGDASVLAGDRDTQASGGVVVVSALGGGAGLADVAEPVRVGLMAGLAAYFDGGAKAQGGGNVNPLPRVRFQKPYHKYILAKGGSGVLPLSWFTRWLRPDGTDFSPWFLGEAFQKPFVATNGDPMEVAYLIKYREASWTNYRFAEVAGQGFSAMSVDAGVSSHPLSITPLPDSAAIGQANTAAWNTSSLVSGNDYYLLIEAYRVGSDGRIGGACSSHEVMVHAQ